jgi:hypothetical protein
MFRNLIISEGVKLLAKSIVENPQNWQQRAYHFSCVSSPDVNIWTANGVFFIRLEGNDSFNIAEKRHINKAIQKCIALKTTLRHDVTPNLKAV